MQNFSSIASTQTDLDKFLTLFSRKIQDFLEENLEFPNLKKVLKRDSQKVSFTNFLAFNIF
jgi:hypothetical protein